MTGRRMFLFFATSVFLFFTYPTQSSALLAYDCSSTTTIYNNHAIPIEDFLPPCDTIKDLETIKAAIVELKDTPTAAVYQCKVTFTQQLIDNRGAVQNITITEIVTKDTCLKAHETKSIDLAGYHIAFLDTNGTVNYTANIEGTNFANDNEVSSDTQQNQTLIRHYTITLGEYEATVDIAKNIIYLQNELVCDFNWFSCQDDFGQHFWKTARLTDTPLFWGNISFTVSNTFLTDPGIRYAVFGTLNKVFVLKTFYSNFTSFNDWPAFPTEVPNVFVVPSQRVPSRDRVSAGKNTLSKLVYSEPYFSGADTVDISKRRCERERQDKRVALIALPVNSTIPVPEIRSVAVKDESGSFRLSICDVKDVTLRSTPDCFREIPVKDEQGRALFLNPVTRFLSQTSDQVACDSLPPETVRPVSVCQRPRPPRPALVLFPSDYAGLPQSYPTKPSHAPESPLSALLQIPLSLLGTPVRLLSSVSNVAFQAGLSLQSSSTAASHLPAPSVASPANPEVPYRPQFAVLPQNPENLLQSGAVPPQYLAVPPQHFSALPQNFGIPPQYPAQQNFAGLSQNFAALPQNFAGIPQNFANLPQNVMGLPQNFAAMPQNFAGIPQNFANLPQNVAGLPQNFAGIPQNFASLHQNFAGLPQNFAGPPQNFARLPQNIADLPQNFEGLPPYPEMIPQQPETVPPYPTVAPQNLAVPPQNYAQATMSQSAFIQAGLGTHSSFSGSPSPVVTPSPSHWPEIPRRPQPNYPY